MNTRKDSGGSAMRKWLATPPGHIAKPLKHIINRDSTRDRKSGQIILGGIAATAYFAARRGDGLLVQKLAMSMK